MRNIQQIFTLNHLCYIINPLMQKFSLMNLFSLNLKRKPVPSYGNTHQKQYPQRIPLVLVSLCFSNSLLKLAVPLVLQQIYSQMKGTQLNEGDYLWLMGAVISAIGLSQAVLITYGLVLSLYRLNVRREASTRVIHNNFHQYEERLQSLYLQAQQQGSMELWMKVNTRLLVYLHNYYQSYLNLIFECFNIVAITLYLFYKLSFSLLFGLAIAGMVMYKTIQTASIMTNVRFNNIALRARRLKVLQGFFSRVSEFKMTWLDKWIYDRVTSIQQQFQNGLREIKMLDCWCVALWQFTGVGISSIVITAYFLLGLNETIDPQSVFSPSTFVYLLGMLNFPLNALSWYIAGIRTAQRAIDELKYDVKKVEERRVEYVKIEQQEGSLIIKRELELTLNQSSQKQAKKWQKLAIPVTQLKKHQIYSVSGELAEAFLSKLPFLMSSTISKGYVQQNGWLCPSSLETICMQPQLTTLNQSQKSSISQLLQLFACADIPLHTNTQNYSGGQKLRISLVRAFHLSKVIVINSNLMSLDKKMREIVQNNIRMLVSRHKNYTIFIKENQEIADQSITFSQITKQHFKLHFTKIDNKYSISHVQSISISEPIAIFMQKAIQDLSKSLKQQQLREAALRVDQIDHNQKQYQKSGVSWQTFKIYYKSPKHIWFLFSMLVVTFLSNYYNFYVNTYINLAHYSQNQVFVIVAITLVFAVGLFFRAYLFADANLDEAQRICHDLNKNIIMEQLPFYQSEQQLKDSIDDPSSKSQLICVLSTDTQTIADQFPFSTNIFANNVTVVISSIVVILLQVPQMLILVCFLITYAHSLNKVSHRKDEALKAAQKQKEVQVYNAVSLLESARKYIIIHNKLPHFSSYFEKLREEQMQLDWLSQRYRGYINMKYKGVMMLFLLIAVAVYSYANVFSENKGNTSSGLALLIQYTIQLSNYLLFFTMSIWEIKGQAVSIERVKPYLLSKLTVAERIAAADSVISKLRKNKEINSYKHSEKPLIEIQGLTFAYESNPNTLIFKEMSFRVQRGDRVIIKGRSGAGKTTLYKILTSAYPKVLNLLNEPFHVSFSPQHPLLLPDCSSLEQNLDPYKIGTNIDKVKAARMRHGLQTQRNPEQLSYQQKIVVNNLRAYLQGLGGVTIYDQPQEVLESDGETCLIVTHHHEFPHSKELHLLDGKINKLQ